METKMELRKNGALGFNFQWTNLLFFLIPLILFWRFNIFFFICDDWTAIVSIAENPLWRHLIIPDAEMWIPLGKLAFFGLVGAFGEHYSMMIMVNSLLTGLNAFLVYNFFRHHFNNNLALALSLFYAGASVHSATAQMAYYINAILCLTFFLSSLLLTESYIRIPSTIKLLGIGLFSFFSILSWNYILLGIWTLPLYFLFFCRTEIRHKFWGLLSIIGIAFFSFAILYTIFPGLKATQAHNPNIFAVLPNIIFFKHWFNGAIISPFSFLFWAINSYIVKVIVTYIFFPAIVLVLLFCKGHERKIGIWALMFNIIPFMLVAMARHHFPLKQAFSHRYCIFTIIGALLLIGIAWQFIALRLPNRFRYQRLLPLGILTLLVYGQISPIPGVRRIYMEWSRLSNICYHTILKDLKLGKASKEDANQPFCPDLPPWINKGQAIAAIKFLNGLP